MKSITSIEQLKIEAASFDGSSKEFFISLNFGAKSSKRIVFNPENLTFDVHNEIDDSYQEDLDEKQLAEETLIIEAIEKGALYKYE